VDQVEKMSVEEITAFLEENPQLRIAECLAPWTQGAVE
jgi:hypothetical protein